MKTQWIIILDSSSSMEEPFKSDYEFKGFTEYADKKKKIEAAKETLLKQVQSLTKDSQITIIEFDSDPRIIFEGSSASIGLIKHKLHEVTASGLTNLPEALNLAIERTAIENYRYIQYLVISDGLSNEGDIDDSIDRLRKLPIRVDTILISPTFEGEEIARLISVNGKVTAVSSYRSLDHDVHEVANNVEKASKEQYKPESLISKLTAPLAITVSLLTAIIILSDKLFDSKVEGLLFASGALIFSVSILLFFYVYKRKKTSPLLNAFGEVFETYQFRRSKRITALIFSMAMFFSGIGLIGYSINKGFIKKEETQIDEKHQDFIKEDLPTKDTLNKTNK